MLEGLPHWTFLNLTGAKHACHVDALVLPSLDLFSAYLSVVCPLGFCYIIFEYFNLGISL